MWKITLVIFPIPRTNRVTLEDFNCTPNGICHLGQSSLASIGEFAEYVYFILGVILSNFLR